MPSLQELRIQAESVAGELNSQDLPPFYGWAANWVVQKLQELEAQNPPENVLLSALAHQCFGFGYTLSWRYATKGKPAPVYGFFYVTLAGHLIELMQ